MYHDKTGFTKGLLEWNGRRIAAAKRAVQREADAMALFPELRRVHTVEERQEQMDDRAMRFIAHMRACRAEAWREVRRILRELPDEARAHVLAKWETRYMPGDPQHLHATILNNAGEPHASRLRAEAKAKLMRKFSPPKKDQ